MANKLGFYLQSFEIGEHKAELFAAIRQIRPPVMLVHAWDQVDQLRRLSPDSLIIGRMTYFGPDRRPVHELVNGWLDSGDPEGWGRAFAEHILRDNFGMATRREGDRLLIDGWMSLNEAVPGPASKQYREQPDEIERRLRAYDAFQAGFRATLIAEGVEAVAFNFGAGNFASAEHYWRFFPRTLANYTYLGFHEYGWPALATAVDPAAVSSAGTYRTIVRELSQHVGRRFEVLLTEAGLTLMYKYPNSADKGWLFTPPPELGAEAVTQEPYWRSLAWLNDYMLEDDFVRGACLFEVGHAGDWETFRHFGQDRAEQDIRIVPRIAQLASGSPVAAPLAAPADRQTVTLHGRIVDENGRAVNGASVRLVGDWETLGADPRAAANNRGAVTWTRRLSGFAGSLWNCWQRYVAPAVAGITWEEFRREAGVINPDLHATGGMLRPEKIYYLPENRVFADTAGAAPVIVWDRLLDGFAGTLWNCWRRYGQGKVLGLDQEHFRRGMLAENPSLAADNGRLFAYKIYRLPRSAESSEYVRTAYTVSGGRFVFVDLPPGAYRLEVSAPGCEPLVQPLTVDADGPVVVLQAPIVLRARAAEFLMEGLAFAPDPFVHTVGRHLALNGRSFRFVGVNLRGLAHYGTPTLPAAPLAQQDIQLRAAHEFGARVVRIFLPDRNASVEEILARLQRLVDLMDRDFPDMYLIVALTNLYGDVPFHVPGDESFYHDNILQPEWFRQGGSEHYRRFVERVVKRFKDVPRIMAYNIGNELKAQGEPEVLVDFMHATAARMRAWDEGRHLISTGMISTRHAWMQHREDLRARLYDTELLDFVTNHAYHGDEDETTSREQENDAPSREDDADLAERFGKPLVIEEAGFVGTDDRTRWFDKELNLLLGVRQASGYMPWGFMQGGDNGDGNHEVGIDQRWHGADWESVGRLLRHWAQTLRAGAIALLPEATDFQPGQIVYTTVPVNLRPAAGLTGAPEQIHLLPSHTPATIQGPAKMADHLTWWPVCACLEDGQEESGWVAQVAPDGTTLLSII